MEGVELISPVFTDADTVTRLTWHSEICDVLGSVCSTVLLRTNESTGYHVHIGIGKAPGQTFTLDELKKIAVITILYEKAIDELHPAHRSAGHGITNTMLRSNRSNLFFVDYETSEVLAHILSARDVKQLTCMMNPALDDLLDSDNKPMNYMRDYKVNFVSVSKYGTIEFRQHEGTIDPAVVCAWADFLLALIRYAMELSAKTMITLDPTNMPLVDIVGKDVYAPLMLCGQ
ncbi:putative amidoligase [Sparassis latifolia]